jgi:ABC-2 type transport system ATP-binding protein
MLRIDGLSKHYGEHADLQWLSLELMARQFVALRSANGAGKSTLFQALTGLSSADEGEVEVAGYSLRRGASSAWRHIGVALRQIAVDLDLSNRRNLLLQADLQGLPQALARAPIDAGCAGWASMPTSTARCVNRPGATGEGWTWCACRCASRGRC